MPVDEDLPSVMAVELMGRNHQYALNLHSNVPIKDIVAMLREVEQNIDYRDTKYCKLRIKVSSNEMIKDVKVYSLKSLEPITDYETSWKDYRKNMEVVGSRSWSRQDLKDKHSVLYDYSRIN